MADYNTPKYLTLSEAKAHLNIDSQFTDDDSYISSLCCAAEDATAIYIDLPLSQLEDAQGKLPVSIMQAMLLLVGGWYAVREAISPTTLTQVPLAYEFLCSLHHDYNINKTE